MKRDSLSRRRFFKATAGVTAGAAVAGCIGGEEEPVEEPDDSEGDDHDDSHDDGHDHEAGEQVMSVDTFELINRDTDEVTNFVHGDHWDPVDGGFPSIPVDGYVSVGAYVEDDGEEVALGENGEYELRARVADGAEEGVVEFDYHGDHVHVRGVGTGLTDIVFQLWHDGHADDETPPLTVQVVEEGEDHDHGDDDEVGELRIFDRAPDPHEEVADWHDGHWHGEIPNIPVGDRISLGAEFEEPGGEEIPIGANLDYGLSVRVADGAEEGVVEIDPERDYHGDHVHIHGVEEGTTYVVFGLWHDDHADWESDPIPVAVGDAEVDDGHHHDDHDDDHDEHHGDDDHGHDDHDEHHHGDD